MMTEPATPRGIRRIVTRVLVRLAALFAVGFVVLLGSQALRDRRMPALETWHRDAPAGEFRAGRVEAGFSFDDYLALEQQLFDRLDGWMVPPEQGGGTSGLIRYVHGGPNDPTSFDPDWNRTTELVPDDIGGGVLLLHGLTDSPYSMRSLATLFRDEGLYALCLRMPGHGTVPAALLSVSWRDWLAAAEIAMRHVRERIGPGRPLYLCGYSAGGAVAMLYVLEALDRPDLPVPDRVFLFSPAIGVTEFAVASNWHRVYSWIPLFEKSRWLSIEPEYDPYKYNSFAKNAGAQIWDLTREVQARLDRAAADGRLDRVPPILAFQSAVDATIVARDVVERLYDRLPPNGSELVFFNVNSVALLDGFYQLDPRPALRELMADTSHPYRLTIVQNVDAESLAVTARTRPPGSDRVAEEPMDEAWPRQVYSLAHVAIPFPPDDPIYGTSDVEAAPGRPNLGDLSLRGEKHVLTVPAADLLRLRCNPFHPFMVRRIRAAIATPEP